MERKECLYEKCWNRKDLAGFIQMIKKSLKRCGTEFILKEIRQIVLLLSEIFQTNSFELCIIESRMEQLHTVARFVQIE